MKPPAIPEDEPARQAALDDYGILDSLAEQEYDDLAFLASSICQTPIALVSLVDRDRQWFKAKVGLDADETPRDISFCGHVVANKEPLFVGDATADDRFADNPLVVGDPSIRFYGGAPLVNPDGAHLGTLCVIDREPRELTVEQRNQLLALSRQVVSLLELRRQRRLAEEANQAKSRFLARMSHELRTPLNAVIGFANVLKKNKGGGLSDRDLLYAERIKSSGVHLLELVNEILDLSRVEAGRETFEYEDVMLSELIADVLHSVPVPDEERAIRLNTSVPATLRTAVVRADARRCRQVLLNLVANAVKFCQEKPIDVVLTDAGDGEVATLAVRDRGPGIPDDQLEYVFGSFNQVDDGPAREGGGTGLGLAIARALCRAMGWELTASNHPDGGAVFTIAFAARGTAPDRLEA